MKKNKYTENKNFPEGSWQRRLYDLFNLPISEYLSKHERNLDVSTQTKWNEWMSKFINPAFDESKYLEMISNFGYTGLDKHDFKKQYEFYEEIKNDPRLDEDTKRFIGFMAGNHFFEGNIDSVDEWFKSFYWSAPSSEGREEDRLDYTINDILNSPYGLNYLKGVLVALQWWSRDVTF